MRKMLLRLLPISALAVLATGCPHNEYLLHLKPMGTVIERNLIFYRGDVTNSNGPCSDPFPRDEVALIERLYPAGAAKRKGEWRSITGRFGAVLPGDVGGAGSYVSISNSLGVGSFYMERFRGGDDLAGGSQLRAERMDQFVNLVLGWSRSELGREPHYADLRRFLDEDFRRDMKNLSFYLWMTQASMASHSQQPEEFAVRLAQYLVERGYFSMEELPALVADFSSEDGKVTALLVQRFIAGKLRIPSGSVMSPAMKALADPNELEKSWIAYLETTDIYRRKLLHWKTEEVKRDLSVAGSKVTDVLTARTNRPTSPPAPARPDPAEVAGSLMEDLIDLDLTDSKDHLSVKLALDEPPTHTNGKWDAKAREIGWEAALSARTNLSAIPVFCYASWNEPNEAFQTRLFGNVAVKDDDLCEYCLWRVGLTAGQGQEWEALLAGLSPGPDARKKVKAFRFSNDDKGGSRSDVVKQMIEDGLRDRKPPGRD